MTRLPMYSRNSTKLRRYRDTPRLPPCLWMRATGRLHAYLEARNAKAAELGEDPAVFSLVAWLRDQDTDGRGQEVPSWDDQYKTALRAAISAVMRAKDYTEEETSSRVEQELLAKYPELAGHKCWPSIINPEMGQTANEAP